MRDNSFDRTIIEGATFDDPARLASEILEYRLYYNELRPHQALGGQTPKVAAEAAGHI
jgi:transposase InsO family protein